MLSLRRKTIYFLFAVVAIWAIWPSSKHRSNKSQQALLLATAQIRSFAVDVRTVGDLEAARSTIVASEIRGDQGKIIHLIPDGMNVAQGDTLVRLDPTPFESKVEELSGKVKESEANVTTQEQTMNWDVNQAIMEQKTALFEVETAAMELEKVANGDGPQEIAKLKSAMSKAWNKYQDHADYADKLEELEEQGFLNPTEVKLANKKLKEEREAYEDAKKQYDSYVTYVFPMLKKKAETALKRAKIKYEESIKGAQFKRDKAANALWAARQSLADLQRQLETAERDLALTEMQAPSPGMVVHRQAYRQGQMRKPRVGDVVLRNQPILELPDLRSMIVKTKVREVDLFKVAIGQPATIQVDAYPDLRCEGQVSSIGVLALADPGRTGGEKFFEVRIMLDQADQHLRPGMTARVTIHANRVNEGVTVPLDAIFSEDNETFCYTKEGRTYRKSPVSVGATNDAYAEISSGLNEGQKVCLVKP